MAKTANTVEWELIIQLLKDTMQRLQSNFQKPIQVTIALRLGDEMIVASDDDLDFVSKYIKKLSKPKK